MLRYVMICYVVVCLAIFCYAMSCCDMLCCVMLLSAMLCHVYTHQYPDPSLCLMCLGMTLYILRLGTFPASTTSCYHHCHCSTLCLLAPPSHIPLQGTRSCIQWTPVHWTLDMRALKLLNSSASSCTHVKRAVSGSILQSCGLLYTGHWTCVH